MSQTIKIIILVIVTALIVGRGHLSLATTRSTVTINNQNRQVVSGDTKIWKEADFSFAYPSQYIADSKGLWTEDGYQSHINPADECSTCQIPYYEIKSENTPQSLDQYIITDFGLPGNTLDEASSKTGILYQNIMIGNNSFIKITVSDLHKVTGYYTKNGNTIIAFRVYWTERDTEELQNIISTLKFDASSVSIAQEKKNIGDPCTNTIECKDGVFCDSRTHTCVRDFGALSEDAGGMGGDSQDIRALVRNFVSKGLGIVTGFLFLISVGIAFLTYKVFGKQSKAGITKKIITVVLLFSTVVGWASVIFAWIITFQVLNITSGV